MSKAPPSWKDVLKISSGVVIASQAVFGVQLLISQYFIKEHMGTEIGKFKEELKAELKELKGDVREWVKEIREGTKEIKEGMKEIKEGMKEMREEMHAINAKQDETNKTLQDLLQKKQGWSWW
ncbi:hypothetical protein GPECTOR_9g715 [Gonium pectorale]|uniref:Uncharacterized protein n=1 Tax=Gonium pectorale TaxID=33097 RepID=A0A150GS24_GONPE|nr:hypothetical protein GPECTOR_9g715 [Gonium pectorale]|eukprot:KXZ52669.1 hypothetical protein GPECTOR_9g715 [Gonium pectorale]